MNGEIEKVTVLRLSEEGREAIEDVVARETPVTILFNNQELVTLLATPRNLDYLAAGFLFSEGLIRRKQDIRKILVDDRKGVVRVETDEDTAEAGEMVFKRIITSGCGRGASFYSAADVEMVKVESQTRLAVPDVLSLAREFQHRSEVYRSTGGVHSAALCDTKSILVFNEDIGRHNAIDKVMGECLMKDIATDDRIVITSGRISSEMLLKIAKRNIPVIISKSAPTDLGVKLATDLGITLLGFVRGKRMNVYAHDWRIVANA
ncbi:MAG: formate dehydrogenase accessory sulfurtransferase FdhD [Chloroflexi bacterium]|nr:formate dehydrogenase accessory sulfurtransferase FdhD [Chloroflexota bacterium]